MPRVTIHLYNQSLKVTVHNPTDTAHRALLDFAAEMLKYRLEVKFVRGPKGPKRISNWVPDGQYAITTARGEYYCFHLHQFDALLAHLQQRGLTTEDIEVITIPDYTPAAADLVMRPEWEDRPHQPPAIAFILKPKKQRILEVQTGQGKAHPLDVRLRTPTGSVAMGDVQIGTVIMGSDGQPTPITGVYPQGTETVYQLRFADGRTERASGGHLWKLQIDCGEWVVRNTLEARALLDAGANLAIPLPDPLVNATATLPDFLLENTILTQYSDGDLAQRAYAIAEIEAQCRQDDIVTVPAACCRTVQRLYRSMGFQATALSSTEIHIYQPTDGTLCLLQIDELAPVATQCITVAAPDSLYVTDNYVVTHNTYITLKAAAIRGERIMIVTRGGYIDKWMEDVKKTYDIDPSRVLRIQATAALDKALRAAAMNEFDYDVVMVSIGAISGYLKLYESAVQAGIANEYIDPRFIGTLFQVGMRIIDEGHQMMHAYFRFELYSHFNKGVVLSATLSSHDEFERKIYGIIYPEADRYKGGKYQRYIDYTAVFYAFENPKAVRCIDREGKYSHTTFEYWVMYAPNGLRERYVSMIVNNAAEFVATRKPGQRMMIFTSTVDMCNIVRKALRRQWPKLKVDRYTATDELQSIMKSDIIVTTPGSGGTAIDIPDLAWVLCTVSIYSYKQKVQMLGRLRELVNYPGERPRFYHLVSTSVPKHMHYYRDTLEVFKPKVASTSTTSIDSPL